MHGDICRWQVVDGRVTGFEDAEGGGGVGEDDAGVDDADVAGGGLEARRAGVVPDGFLGRSFAEAMVFSCGKSRSDMVAWRSTLQGQ